MSKSHREIIRDDLVKKACEDAHGAIQRSAMLTGSVKDAGQVVELATLSMFIRYLGAKIVANQWSQAEL